jgi:hypothetical protein
MDNHGMDMGKSKPSPTAAIPGQGRTKAPCQFREEKGLSTQIALKRIILFR